jgi:hypothetical protein
LYQETAGEQLAEPEPVLTTSGLARYQETAGETIYDQPDLTPGQETIEDTIYNQMCLTRYQETAGETTILIDNYTEQCTRKQLVIPFTTNFTKHDTRR